jgi:hypothetical protein
MITREIDIEEFRYFPSLKLLYLHDTPKCDCLIVKGRTRDIEFTRSDGQWKKIVNALSDLTIEGYKNIFLFKGEEYCVLLAEPTGYRKW